LTGKGGAVGLDLSEIPMFDDLPVLSDSGERHSWDVFGPDDQLGTQNFVRPHMRAAAAMEVCTGETVCLSLPLDVPDARMFPSRTPYRHHISRSRGGRDDSLDNFYLQGSSQWDGLAHIRFRQFGYYGGREEDALDQGALGIDAVARRGIISRGVLVDVLGFFKRHQRDLDPQARVPIGVDLIEEVLADQGCVVSSGDAVLVRTGWLGWYKALDEGGRAELTGIVHNREGGMECPGLASHVDTARWLWDHRVSAIAADNPALEVLRVRAEEGFLHRRLIALLGMTVGELFDLDDLADKCRQMGRWTFLLTSSPLNVPRGVGSPNNAHATF
jgi:kynurenine formamidase